ncbi:MAG: hypothetical protein K0Q72_2286 [Armatimonadetes bacterium]|nr:hypothetical protein [Armatimonadota bacterium]
MPHFPDNAHLLSRRQLLQSVGMGFGALALTDLLHSTAAADTPAPLFAPRAKRVIFMFMSGGPSHVDMLDPKPAIEKYQGQRPGSVDLRTERKTGGLLPSPHAFKPGGKSDVVMSDLLPRLRTCADDLCVLRSVYGSNPNHGPAINFMLSGRIDQIHPAVGAWVSYGLGTENQNLPGFVALGNTFVPVGRSGYLPGEHQGTPIVMGQDDPEKMIAHLRNRGLSPADQERQLQFIQNVNRAHSRQRGEDPLLEARIHSMETAFRMQFAATEAFDLRKESAATRAQYGNGDFANACLLARRLVENGVRFVQITNGGWDHHDNIDREIGKKCREIDQPMAALIQDLKQRGLLDDTLVIWGGEFGRTPVSENGNGRDHNPYGFSMWLAGGGVKAGYVHGATDEFGFKAVDKPMSVHDLHATILHLLGLDHEKLTYRYSGRNFRLTDVEGVVAKEILA